MHAAETRGSRNPHDVRVTGNNLNRGEIGEKRVSGLETLVVIYG